MDFQVTSRLELNVVKASTNAQWVADAATRYRIPAIVAEPSYVAPLMTYRSMSGSRYKIICAIDFPAGQNFAMDKLKRSNPDFTAADGFEILISDNRSEIELRNEMKSLYEFIKMQNRLLEIRWCLGAYHRDPSNLEHAVRSMSKYPPSYVRVDSHVDLPKVTLEQHEQAIDQIREQVHYPIKISGNVDLDLFNKLKSKAARFDVNVDQLNKIVYDLGTVEDESRQSNPVDNLEGVRKANVQRLVNGGLKIQRSNRLK